MKKSTIVKSLGLKSNASTTSLLKKTMQVTAFTFSCLVALPSFVQTADAQSCPYNGGCVTAYGDYDPWGGWNGWGNEGQGCQGIGCESSDDGGSNNSNGGSNNNGAVCVSEQEFVQNVQICVVTTLGATGAAIGVLNGAACSTCFIAPNIASCGTCAVLTVFTGFAVNLAASQCQPPEMEVCP